MKFIDALNIYTANNPTKFKKDSLNILAAMWSLMAIAQHKLDDIYVISQIYPDGKSIVLDEYLNEIRATLPENILAEFKKAGVKFDDINKGGKKDNKSKVVKENKDEKIEKVENNSSFKKAFKKEEETIKE
jgi:hypothetical protein